MDVVDNRARKIDVAGELMVNPLETPGGFWKRLVTPKKWRIYPGCAVDIYGVRVEVQAGVTDFSSVPRLIKWVFPDDAVYSTAAVLHDQWYRTGAFSKWLADALFYEVLRTYHRMPRVTAGTMWVGVLIGGWPAWLGHRRKHKGEKV